MKKEEFFSIHEWYHGTINRYAKSIIRDGIDASINIGRPLDFGPGFYITPNRDWALNYVRQQLNLTDTDMEIHAEDGYVLKFYADWKSFGGNVRYFNMLDADFAEYVFKWRRYPRLTWFLQKFERVDLIGGPMSDGSQIDDFNDFSLGRITKGELFERLLQPKEDWQLCVQSQRACDTLQLKEIYDLRGEVVNGF